MKKTKNFNRKSFLTITLTLWVVSLIFLVFNLVAMRYATGLPRLVSSNELDSPSAYTKYQISESTKANFRYELEPIITKYDSEEDKVLAILEWTMNQIPKVESRYLHDSWEMIETGRSGQGLICGGMAKVFLDALLSLDIPARSITLQRNLFDLYDVHASVEVWLNGKWRLFDPTFHIELRQNKARVGVFDARNYFIRGIGQPVNIEFLGEVLYPVRIENYHLKYESHFNNVYVDMQRDIGFLGKLPVVGRWLSRELVYSDHESGVSTMPQKFYQFLYYGTLVVAPVINLTLFVVILVLLYRKREESCN